ncbi:MAG: DsrE family protein [Pseudomonadota bacterium]|nr:DsrE family protein [Pseudomonadota bacterium]
MLLLSSKQRRPAAVFSLLFLLTVLFSAALLSPVSSYAADDQVSEEQAELKFPGEDTDNKLVYHFNKSDESYQLAVLNTIRNMLRKYGDDIKIVVSVMGPGIHMLLKEPGVPVIPAVRDQVASLAFYGVEFHACGNTLITLNKEEKDVLEFASVVKAGVSDLMLLQQQGYAYISW